MEQMFIQGSTMGAMTSPTQDACSPGDGCGGGALQVEQLLESGGRRLEQVDQRSEGREDHRSKEKDQDQPAAGDGAEHVGQIDEHEAGAALVQLLAGHRHGGMMTRAASRAATVSKTATILASEGTLELRLR